MPSSRSRKTPNEIDPLRRFNNTIMLQSYDPNYVSPPDNNNELRTPLELAEILAESARNIRKKATNY